MATIPTEKVEKPGPKRDQRAETRPAARLTLALPEMPTPAHFVRDHFGAPTAVDPELEVEGRRRLTISMDELQRRGELVQVRAVLECAGHRRAELNPPASGVQWGVGAVSEAIWGGLPLRELLERVGVDADAQWVILEGADRGLRSDDSLPVPFARAIPVAKACESETIVAWKMNGADIPSEYGGPLRAIVPGHYAVDSVKWLKRITISRDRFDGPFQRLDYRLLTDDLEDGEELHALPVHALILSPAQSDFPAEGIHRVRGIAWGGDGGVANVHVRIDERQWRPAQIERTSNYGRVFWHIDWDASVGRHELAVRATDAAGNVQPETPRWNRLGYGNNSWHRVAIYVAAG